MTDLEMTKFCAEAMGYIISDKQSRLGKVSILVHINGAPYTQSFSPLSTDAQAMMLVKNFTLCITYQRDMWIVGPYNTTQFTRNDSNLNRAICACVAEMAQSRKVTEIK